MSQKWSTRKRSRIACDPCRERKRKCDGADPCTTCREWGYDCSFQNGRRKRRTTQEQFPLEGPTVAKSPQNQNGVADTHGLVRRLEANSGAAFVRKMGLKIDPAKAPKLSLFGWNVGTRKLSSGLGGINTALSITEITSVEHMRSLAQVYFDKVDPCYGFIDRDQFFERLEARWLSESVSELHDSVLGGVAAIGCLFSQRNMTITELHLSESARSILETHVLSGTPSVDLLTGWTLRVVYLRLTDLPHSTWIASSRLMHLIEAAGFHLETTDSVFPSSSATTQCDPDIRRRLFGVAQHLNMWTSFDLGLSRVSFQKNDLPRPPSTKPGDYTNELLGLLPISASLDPGKSKEDDTDLEVTLAEVLDRVHKEPPSTMAQCNLVLCILRRIHTQNLDISSSLAEKVLVLLKRGLGCSRNMAMSCSPWHQMVNVPFHITCVLLVMDTRSSLAMLSEAMQTLKLVASTYDTDTMREAWSAARLLVMLYQQRRKDDLAIFSEALNMESQETPVGPSPRENPSAEEYSWLGALVADLPGLDRIDLDQFLNADMMGSSSFLGGSD
ncbi:hypothetical protein PENANT_c006G08155 [Penicillium antarcticum]|uniref:Zn(2)-C6 fungal-type domain-containing protein n=1 Tax=Penicillium antarcticum TaxID=416450 RepID=A0A1V6QD99_9EURO|nr:uncharacterized protein N7508_009433 [Penicillium antarcticum]KAJ5294612.1 hypothetical protein N7508_009433 [Penicillium antarcticum]OQD87183.1 hypothetical protein PENANT_c006G08155 [Penicillium antarcticum]